MNRFLAWLAILLVTIFCGWWFWPYFLPASGQVSHQQALFLKKAGQQDWKGLGALVAADYHDAAGMTKDRVLETAQEVLEPFLLVSFDWTDATVVMEDKKATVTGTLRMHATPLPNSGGAGSVITDRVNHLRDPWVFVWRKDGWNPEDWRLISVSNAEVENLPH